MGSMSLTVRDDFIPPSQDNGVLSEHRGGVIKGAGYQRGDNPVGLHS